MKYFLVKDPIDDSKWVKVGARGFTPANSIPLPSNLEQEDSQWLIVQDVTESQLRPVFDGENPVLDENSDQVYENQDIVVGQEVVVDEALKAQILAERAQQETENQWVELRRQRDSLLFESDWTQLADAPLDAPKKAEWVTYRQALRDLPANTVDPETPVFPAKPE